MLILQGVTYTHPNRELLFSDLDLVVNEHDKLALIGNNGVGKSTLLKLMAGDLTPTKGMVKAMEPPFYLPQNIGQFDTGTVAQAIGIEARLQALKAIEAGDVSEKNMAILVDDWTVEDRCREAFEKWGLQDLGLAQPLSTLSGGQKTRLLLAAITIHNPAIVLMDEPSNHLDANARTLLYEYIRSTRQTLVVVSHDRTLLNGLDRIAELGKNGITTYGGNYDFYVAQKALAANALEQNVKEQEKTLRKAKQTERESLERQQKLDARGKKKQEKAGLPTISMNTFRNNAEKSTAKLKDVHAEKLAGIARTLDELRKELPENDKMRLDFDDANLHKGKCLVKIVDVNFQYTSARIWKESLNLDILSGERLALRGKNGAGKTTLIKMILQKLAPTKGTVTTANPEKIIYIDQDYSLIDNSKTVYEQAESFNATHLQEHEIKNRLTRFLFPKEYWDRSCTALSGGERMRLALCCLNIGNQAPDMIILDEPTNNLDIQNIAVLTTAIEDYKGTLMIVTHDEYFLKEIGVTREIEL